MIISAGVGIAFPKFGCYSILNCGNGRSLITQPQVFLGFKRLIYIFICRILRS